MSDEGVGGGFGRLVEHFNRCDSELDDYEREYSIYAANLRGVLDKFDHKGFSASVTNLEFPLMESPSNARGAFSAEDDFVRTHFEELAYIPFKPPPPPPPPPPLPPPWPQLHTPVTKQLGVDPADSQAHGFSVSMEFCKEVNARMDGDSALLVITGGPNSGKSMISKAVGVWLLDIGFRPVIYVRGRHIGDDLVREGYDPELDEDSIWQTALLRSAKRVCNTINEQLFSDMLSRQQPIIIIDGLDEAMKAGSSSALRMWLNKRISSLLYDFILTSRPTHVKFLDDKREQVRYHVMPLDRDSEARISKALSDEWVSDEKEFFSVRPSTLTKRGWINQLTTPLRVLWTVYLTIMKRGDEIRFDGKEFERIIIDEAIKDAMIEKVGTSTSLGEAIHDEPVGFQALRHIIGLIGVMTFPSPWSNPPDDKMRGHMHRLLQSDALGFPVSFQNISDREFEKLVFEEMGALYLTDDREIEWDNQYLQENAIALLLTHDDYDELRSDDVIRKLGIELPSIPTILLEDSDSLHTIQTLIIEMLGSRRRQTADELIEHHVNANGPLQWPLPSHMCKVLYRLLDTPPKAYMATEDGDDNVDWRKPYFVIHYEAGDYFDEAPSPSSITAEWAKILFDQWLNYLSGDLDREKLERLVSNGHLSDDYHRSGLEIYAKLGLLWLLYSVKLVDRNYLIEGWRGYDQVLADLLPYIIEEEGVVERDSLFPHGLVDYRLEPPVGFPGPFKLLESTMGEYRVLCNGTVPFIEDTFYKFIRATGVINRHESIESQYWKDPPYDIRDDIPELGMAGMAAYTTPYDEQVQQLLTDAIDSDEDGWTTRISSLFMSEKGNRENWGGLNICDLILCISFERAFVGDGTLLEVVLPLVEESGGPRRATLWDVSPRKMGAWGWIYVNLDEWIGSQEEGGNQTGLAEQILSSIRGWIRNMFLPEGVRFSEDEKEEIVSNLNDLMNLPKGMELFQK